MKKSKYLPYIVGIVIFYALSYIYFSPLLEGKEIIGGDHRSALAQQKQIFDYHDKYGKWPRWTDANFSGMPTTFIYSPNDGNLIEKGDNLLRDILGSFPARPLMLMLLGFFFLLRVLKVDPWLSIVGAVGYGFTTFFFILIPAGHNTQVYAFAYLPPLIAAVIYAYQINRWVGTVLVGIFASWELAANHPQMAYYGFLILAVFVLVYLFFSIKEKTWKSFITTSVMIVVCGVFAAGTHMDSLYPQYKYQKNSIRGKSELTVKPENSSSDSEEDGEGSGLTYEYATRWSYGIDETLTILIPNLKGGALENYWGEQPFTAGPMYIGAIIVFLFVLGMFILTGPIRWWLLIATALAILLCWGHNSVVYDFFYYYVPLFNKFRNPVWALVIANVTMPLGAALALQKIISRDFVPEKLRKQLIYTFAVVGGICLLFWVAPGLSGRFEKVYTGADGTPVPEYMVNAQQYSQQTGQAFNQQLVSAFERMQDEVIDKRRDLLRNDALRSFALILAAAALIALFIKKKGFNQKAFILIAGILILFDLWGINKRFLNDDNFTPKKKDVIQPTKVNTMILQAEAGNRNYRVLDLTMPIDVDTRSIYFHPSLGGYNAAKLMRYNELINFHLAPNYMALRGNLQKYDSILARTPVMNMLNTKYIIYNPDQPPIVNQHRLGAAWFVKNIHWVSSADEEILGLNGLNPSETVVIHSKHKPKLKFTHDGQGSVGGNITVTSYEMDDIIYDVSADQNSFAVFSEIYYPNWHAYIDGQETPVIQCNYVLRGIEVPQGKHKVEFKYIPKEYAIGSTIAYASSFAIIALILGLVGVYFYRKRKVVK